MNCNHTIVRRGAVLLYTHIYMAVLILYGDIKALDWRIWKGPTTVIAVATIGRYDAENLAKKADILALLQVWFSVFERMYIAGLSLSGWRVNKYYCKSSRGDKCRKCVSRLDKKFEGLVAGELAFCFTISSNEVVTTQPWETRYF